ncbi:HNH endonuclease signature motif containing protein [Pseudomonas sp. BRM28]|uniref:HNH endonuclease signature motif containing protein n=1 Tax=Pseudomonas sp. BRM28 TaxID=2045201 RepID=UPI000CEE93CE|nr:hypothetical protein CR917_08615 [Pseudomonas sp. BRM28]
MAANLWGSTGERQAVKYVDHFRQEARTILLTRERLREQLTYDRETGEFRWAVRKQKVKLGSVAGKVKKSGYVEIRIDLVSYQAHRLAWLYVTGQWPQGDIDHINRSPGDNRFVNLREASRSQNLCNVGALSTSATGVRGVDLQGQRQVPSEDQGERQKDRARPVCDPGRGKGCLRHSS